MQPLQLSKKLRLLLSFLLVTSFCFSQVTEQWVKRYNGPGNGNDNATSLAVDAFSNVYVTGSSHGGETGYDYATISYDAAGNERWAKRYNGPANRDDAATSLAVDAFGNVYVTGYIDYDGSSAAFATIKYDTLGNERWVKHYNGPANFDLTTSLAVDASGNVYVTGESYGSGTGADYATIKYDAAGNELWVQRYNGLENADDSPVALAVDASGNVYVTGWSQSNPFSIDYATIKYNSAGTELWVKRYDGPAGVFDFATSLAVDASGNVYVTGRSDNQLDNPEYATVKYDADGNELWAKRYTEGSSDLAFALAVDTSGNLYVTGTGGTIKYSADGALLWAMSGSGSLVAVDASGNAYVTGGEATTKYSTAGAVLWKIISSSSKNDLVLDGSGKVYVTGYSFDSGRLNDYATIMYSQTQAATVSSFTLIDAGSDTAIRELKDGDTINLEALSTLNLNIGANASPFSVGSVAFSLNGAEIRTHIENILPYALFADDTKGDYYSWIPSNGNYTLTATPYSEAKGKGTKGTPLTIHFHVTGQVVSSLILVNAETNQDIKALKNGDVIDLSALPTDKLNIRAVVHPDTVESVVFNMNNKVIVWENLVPYAIGGDIKGNFRPWTLPTGKHLLTATPYTGKYGRGTKGKSHSVNFTVVNMASITQMSTQKTVVDEQGASKSLKATPNPFSSQTTISFSVPKAGRTVLEVCNMKGVVVEHLYDAQAEAGITYRVPFNSKGLTSGIYMLRVVADRHIQSTKLILIR